MHARSKPITKKTLLLAALILGTTALSPLVSANSGGIFEDDNSGFDRGTPSPADPVVGGTDDNIGCGNSGCHAHARSTQQIGFLTLQEQTNVQSDLAQTTFTLGETYQLRFHNSDAAVGDRAGFSLSTTTRNGVFVPADADISRASGDGDEITHAFTFPGVHQTWLFDWTPDELGDSAFEWCTQKVNGNFSADGDNDGPDDDGSDGPFNCGFLSFSVEEEVVNSPPTLSGDAVQTFLATDDVDSRTIVVTAADDNEGDEGELTFQWSPVDFLSDAQILQPQYMGSGQQVYTLVATDPSGANSNQFSVTVDIDPIPVAVLTGAPGAAVQEGTTVTFSGASSTDLINSNDAGAIANYSFTLLDAPDGTEVNSQDGTLTNFEVTVEDVPTGETLDLEVVLVVTDLAGQVSDPVTAVVRFSDPAAGIPPPAITELVVSGSDASAVNNEDETITLTATVMDGVGDVDFEWTQISGTPIVTLTGVGNTRAFVPNIDNPATPGPQLEFSLTVTDASDRSATETVTVLINNGPTAAAGDDTTVNEGATVVLDGSGSSDPDLVTDLEFSWAQTSGQAFALTGADTATPQFQALNIPPAGVVAEFALTVTDNGGLTSTDSVQITINNSNSAPVASAGSVQTVVEGELTTLNGSGTTDDEPGTLVYSWSQTGGLAVSLSDAGAIMPTFTAPAIGFDSNPVLTFELLVTDEDNETSTATVMVNVSNDNMAPIANAGPAQSVPEGVLVTLNGNGSTDPDLAQDDALSFAWNRISGDAAFELENADTATPSFTAPSVGPAGLSATFELTVTDRGQLVDTDQTVVNVVNENQPPVADAGPDQGVMGGATVQLDGSASQDPDGPLTSQVWLQVAGPAVALDDPAILQPSFVAPPAATTPTVLTWRLTVVGNEDLQAQDEVTITVAASGAFPPVVNAGPDQVAVPGNTVTLQGGFLSASIPVEIQWQQVDGMPTVTLSDANSTSPEFVAPDVGPAGLILVFEFSVTNENALTATDRVEVRVQPAGSLAPPLTAVLPGVRTVQVGATATAFLTAINSSSTEVLEGCFIAPDTPFPGSLLYQTTNPTTNALVGQANTPVDIPARGSQSFLISLTPTAVFAPTDLSFSVQCTNAPRARSVSGLNTLLFGATDAPTADVIALSATSSEDGVLRVPGAGSSAAFGTATFNLGATAILRLVVDTPEDMPVEITVCETNPATAQCVAPAVPEINTNAFREGSATYSVFVRTLDVVNFDPENARISVRFMEGELVRGVTSVAITTQ